MATGRRCKSGALNGLAYPLLFDVDATMTSRASAAAAAAAKPGQCTAGATTPSLKPRAARAASRTPAGMPRKAGTSGIDALFFIFFRSLIRYARGLFYFIFLLRGRDLFQIFNSPD